jgi:hypothetical protein
LFVGERHSQAIDLQFADVLELRVRQDVLRAPVPGQQLLFVASVGKAEHRYRVAMLLHVLRRAYPHALSGRVGRLQFGMLLLDALQLDHHLVVFRVGQRRIILHVVLVVGLLNSVTQLCDARFQAFLFACTGVFE